jgi:hypothetical protein
MYIGFRIWYGDGKMLSNKDGTWKELPSQDVQFVTFYENRTYEIWIEDKWVTENYVVQLHSEDYYWYDSGKLGAGSAEDVPELPQGAVKTGAWMFEETGVAFWDLAAEAQTWRIAP